MNTRTHTHTHTHTKLSTFGDVHNRQKQIKERSSDKGCSHNSSTSQSTTQEFKFIVVLGVALSISLPNIESYKLDLAAHIHTDFKRARGSAEQLMVFRHSCLVHIHNVIF
jgi:hypothetical protein